MEAERSAHALVTAIAITVLVVAISGPAGAAEPEQNATVSVEVNCTASAVQFNASEQTHYVASVTVVDISPSQVSTVRQTRTVSGNGTLSAPKQGDVVAGFASTEIFGGNETIPEKRLCKSTNETAAAW
jgi:predicted transcriptional regulator